jgi:DNA modification methylase
VTYEPLDQLLVRRHPKNPKAHDLGAVRASIERFGFRSPVLLNDTDGTIVEGHGRVDTLAQMQSTGAPLPSGLQLGPEAQWLVPTVHVRLEPGQADAYRIAANRTVELGGWNDVLLADILPLLAQSGEGLTGIGFTTADIEALVASVQHQRQSNPDPEEIPPAPSTRDVRLKLGDLVRLGEHRLVVGDATRLADVQRAVGLLPPTVLWTDPPYGVNYTGGTKERLTIANDDAGGLRPLLSGAFSAANAVLAPGSPVYVCHPAGPLSMVVAEEFCRVGWSFRQELVWVKNSLVLGRSDYMYRHEPVLYGFKPGPGRLGRGGRAWHGGNDASSVFEIPRPSASPDHPTAKPVRLVEAMLRNSSRAGDTILDPFVGSGTTLIACELLSRRFVGLELDPRYAQVTVDRWERYAGRRASIEGAR